jgi:hypothetical protein
MRLLLVAALTTAMPLGASAQVKVRTETIRPAEAPPATNQFVLPAPPSAQVPFAAAPSAPEAASPDATAKDSEPASSPPVPGPEVATDQTRVPAAVAETRARILATAATGNLDALLALMRANTPAPAFSHTQRQDPIAYWKELYPDSGGIEILGILTSILDTPPAHLNAGTSQEIYVWPYFARLPIASLTPAQKVELFRVVTGFDYKGMLERGRYVFYQVGITPDGTWRYFLAADE